MIYLLIVSSILVVSASYFGYLDSSPQFAPENVDCSALVNKVPSDFRGYSGYVHNVDGWCCNVPKDEIDDPKMCKSFKCFDASSDRLRIVDLRGTTAELVPFWRAGECSSGKKGSYAVEYKSMNNRFTFETPGRVEGSECRLEEAICFNRHQEFQAVISQCDGSKWIGLYNSKYTKEGFLGCTKQNIGRVECEQNCGGTIRNIFRDMFKAKESQRVVKDTKNIIGLPEIRFSECELGLKETNLWAPPECVPEVPI